MSEDHFNQQMLSLLQCVKCAQPLTREHRPDHEWTGLRFKTSEYLLRCSGCGVMFPFTEDGIPVIWTDQLREVLNDEITDITPLSANMDVYDSVSGDYMKYWRINSHNARRLQSAARKMLGQAAADAPADSPPLHLDFGCGPGHVLNWLREFGFRSVGLDVSLSNLRNTRDKTGAFVVLASATDMPFKPNTFHLVTESSALHHIDDWQSVLRETIRITRPEGGIVIDTEPSREAKDWSLLATWLFRSRWYPYKVMSYFMKSKFWFRDLKMARLTFQQAEIHNRPGTGLAVDEIEALFDEAGFDTDVVRCPDTNVEPKGRLAIQEMILHALSLHNPFNRKYGWFTLLAKKRA